MKLLITEKPSVAREFAKVLKVDGKNKGGYMESNGWIITWCVGHLVTMSYPEKYDEKLKQWRLDTLPFMPKEYKYEVIENVQKQFDIVQKLLQREDVEEIYNAGDSGREGEYIQRLVFMMAKPNPKAEIKRVWIDSQTEEEISRGIREAKSEREYDSISDSAYLRAKEDYLIGINFSRLLSIIYGNRLAKSLNQNYFAISVGRVMTCVLGMIVSREREIRNFVKTKYYKIIGTFANDKGEFKAEWTVNEKSNLFESPLLYNESGFKKEEIAKKFKIKPDQTLEIIQTLYERKLVTYPRTDARVLSTAVAKEISKNLNGLAKNFQDEEIQSIMKKMVEEKYSTNLVKTKYVNDSKITDHYAIIPTGQGFENYNGLNELQANVYKLIVRRFLAIFYPPAEYNKINVTVNVENETFLGTGKVCVKRGFLDVLKPEKKQDKKDEDGEENTNLDVLNTLKKNETLQVQNYELKDAETSPPSRYNSGNLVLAMENAGKLIEEEELREQIKGAGIGTSATRGEIIKKLEKIQYIQINSKTQIVTPTVKGEAIYDVVYQAMPDILNPKLTASWEKGLDMVAKKEIEPQVFMDKLENYIRSKFDKLVVKM